MGSLLLLHTGEQPLSADGLALAKALAGAATIGLLQTRTIRGPQPLNEQSSNALQSRMVIEQAKAILAARRNIWENAHTRGFCNTL
ncbi:ANTAR domain-containing protein [Streptomyces sp. NPDC059759]|uniref:ANTAR domain-containing protein n=1 Tax=Streptomyces sp. NPDC059759 TaxID=3346936 RepID=UPI003662A2D4